MLRAARASTPGQVIAIVQPHRYTRLASLFDQFATCFNDADLVIVADTYAAGEQPIEGADRDSPRAGPQGPRPPPRAAARRARRHRRASCASIAKPGDYVVFLGAGTITNWAYALPGELAALDGASDELAPAAERHDGAGLDDRRRCAVPGLRGALRGRRAAGALLVVPHRRAGEVLFEPADEADLAAFLAACPADVPVTGHRARLQPAGARRRGAGAS